MAIDYEKLLSLPIPEVEHAYTDKDAMLYALGVGLGIPGEGDGESTGQSSSNSSTKRTSRFCPPTRRCLAIPAFGCANLDTGIDWVRLVNGEQGVVLHRPLKPTDSVIGRTRIVEVIDKGEGKGALVYTERKVTDRDSGEPARDRDANQLLPRRWRIRRPAPPTAAGRIRCPNANPTLSATCRRGPNRH